MKTTTNRVHRNGATTRTAEQVKKSSGRNRATKPPGKRPAPKSVTVILFDPANDEPILNFSLPAEIVQLVEQQRQQLQISLREYYIRAIQRELGAVTKREEVAS